MVAPIKQLVTVESDGTIRIPSGLQPGTRAEVTVTPAAEESASPISPGAEDPELITWASLRGSGKGSFKSVEEVDAFIRAERDAWEE